MNFKKIFMFFSSHNNITQVDNHIHLSNLLSEKICLDTIKEKWNNTEFLGATELLNNLIKETKNDQSQVNFLLLKASLYFSIESWDITNELLQYIEKNYPKEIKDCYEYFELKFLLNPTKEIEDILKIRFSIDSQELELKRLYSLGLYDEFMDKCKNKNTITYLLLKLNTFNSLEDLGETIKQIKNMLKNESIFFKLYIMSKIIEFLYIHFQLYLKTQLKDFLIEYMDIFEKNIKNENLLKEKSYIFNIINTYISSKFLFSRNSTETKELLLKYINFLDTFNRIELLIIENKGYKNYIEEILNKNDLNSLEIILSQLFFNAKYKYILKIFKDIKLEITLEIYLIKIFSKIFKDIKLDIKELESLENELNKNNPYVTLFHNVLKLKKDEISWEYFKNIILNLLENTKDDLFFIILLRLIYPFNNYWIINLFLDNQEKYKRFIPEVVILLGKDSNILSFKYDTFIEKINFENENINFTNIGEVYIQYRNPQKAFSFLSKEWNISKTEELARKILNLSLAMDKNNESFYLEGIYDYLITRCKNLEEEFLLNIYLSFKNKKEAYIKLNKLLLNNNNKLKKASEIIYKCYIRSFTNIHKEEYFENTTYIIGTKKYIPSLYFELDQLKLKNYIPMDQDKLQILIMENEGKKQNFNTVLLEDFVISTGGWEQIRKTLPGIKALTVDKNNEKNLIQKLEELSGIKEIEHLRKKYFSKEKSNNKIILMSNLYSNFFELNILIEEFINNFDISLLNKLEKGYKNKKLISPNSILFLHKLDLLNCIKDDSTVYFQKSVYEFFKEESNRNNIEALKIIKILHEIKNRMIDDEYIGSLVKEKDKKLIDFKSNEIQRLFYFVLKEGFDYITEDANVKIFNKILNSYSSLILVTKEINFYKISNNPNLQKIINKLLIQI